ncbi:MAG TPA: alternative ribosome rescue aminoacyl-tRNA hydrolase ArfB [Gemmatimonadales bacterium]|jgi:ribosome-associated protein
MTFTVPVHEVDLRFSRASGPGGQHVNKTSTRVEALWNVKTTSALSDEQRARVLTRLANRVDAEGFLRIVAQDFRSQLRNRTAALERLGELIGAALHVPKPRRKTKPTKASREARIAQKKHRGRLKGDRRRRGDDD